MNFISERNKTLHTEELIRMKHRRAIFEKSYGARFKTAEDVNMARIPRRERDELFNLVMDIAYHEVYFSSFGNSGTVCGAVREQFGSEASFLYSLYECAMHSDGGFLLIFNDRGKIEFSAGRDVSRAQTNKIPCLTVDLEEHAYFYDYFFERDRYLSAALSSLNLLKIENTVEKKEK